MWKVLVLPVAVFLLLHLYILFRTGHFDPCGAAYSKLEFEALGTFKSGKRWLVPEEGERAELYEAIGRRDIVQCYKIALR
jgi:hypothetical protein